MVTVDTSSIEHLRRAAEEARRRGDEAEYWRLRLQYLNEQARLYVQSQQQRQRGRR